MPFQITGFDFGQSISFISRMVGHAVNIPDPAGSSDPAIVQMATAVNVALGEMLTLAEWQDLTEKGSIPIVADMAGQKEKAFDLPVDFYRFIDMTQWGKQTMLPALGPVSPQAWQMYVVRNYTPQLTLFWQVRGDKLNVLNPPFPDPIDFEFFYLSRGQVIDQDDPTILKNVASKNGDKYKLDGALITLLARVKYLEWKGFDSSATMRDFLNVFNSRAGADKGAGALTLNRVVGIPLITPMANLPVTGYGT